LAVTASQVRQLIMSFSKQVIEQRKYHKRVQASMGAVDKTSPAAKLLRKKQENEGSIKDSISGTGVHEDQMELVAKLKAIQKIMKKVKLLYQGQDMNIWDFAGLFQSGNEEYMSGHNALFEEKVKKTKLSNLCETLTDVESFIYQIFDETDAKS